MSAPAPPPLPEGWTEHKAPDGRTYYYNVATKKSTYTRPVPVGITTPPPAFASGAPPSYGFPPPQALQAPYVSAAQPSPDPYSTIYGQPQRQRRERPAPTDRPKKKDVIPGCEPWLLISTRLGRRFVYNPDTGVSLWKFPEDVMKAVIQYDIRRKSAAVGSEPEKTKVEEGPEAEAPVKDEAVDPAEPSVAHNQATNGAPQGDSDEEEIIEEIIEEEEEEFEDDQAAPEQTARTDQGELEFGFDDLEDLDAMEEQEEDNGAQDDEEEVVNENDARDNFYQLLDDLKINPFTTWDAIIESNTAILDDYRYTLLPTTKTRREAFAAWSSERIQTINQQRAQQASQNPRIPFLAFLQAHPTPKLFWPEFKRKFKAEPEIRDVSITDKEKEKIYREFLKRVTKMDQETLQSDLKALLKEIPATRSWNRTTTLESTLPSKLLSDVRYVSLKPKIRDPIIQQHIMTLPEPVDLMDDDERAAHDREQTARRKQEAAIRQRQNEVEEKKQAARRSLAQGRSRLAANEEETRRAMVVDRSGLKESL